MAAPSYLSLFVGLYLTGHIFALADSELTVWKFQQNRYLIPLSFIVNLYAYFSHSWNKQVSFFLLKFPEQGLILSAFTSCSREWGFNYASPPRGLSGYDSDVVTLFGSRGL